MDVMDFARMVYDTLPYTPNTQQVQLIAALARFCSKSTPSDSVFLLNGYAGTGKTSLCAALVHCLNTVGIGTVLLAPTGRAAKVFGTFAHHPAYTIHRRIYNVGGSEVSDARHVSLAENRARNTVFIVDEASMIGNDATSGYLLEHLVHYVYSGVNCRMILLGDTAQLPPVGCDESPAMVPEVLRGFGLRVSRAVITATVRQASDSGILYNATWLRHALRKEPLPAPVITESPFSDVHIVAGEELEDMLSQSYAENGVINTILITRSNKRATSFNLAVRNRIFYHEEMLCRDEILIVAKNNYFWSREVKGLDFIANGDIAVVDSVHATEQRYGMNFADVTLRLPYRDTAFDCKIMLDTLTLDEAHLSREVMVQLYEKIINDPDDPEESAATRAAKALKSPYFNALQVKYGYALTCHKAQGGQWDNVYIDAAGIDTEAIGHDFFRWLYTAITRATQSLYIINPTITVR